MRVPGSEIIGAAPSRKESQFSCSSLNQKIVLASIALDECMTLERVRLRTLESADSSCNPVALYRAKIEQEITDIQHAVEAQGQLPTNTLNYFTLLHRSALHDEALAATSIFAHANPHRTEQLQASVVSSTNILATILDYYDSEQYLATSEGLLVGALHEIQFHILANIDEEHAFCAFPASYADDIQRKTDAHLLHTRPLSPDILSTPVQIKSGGSNGAPSNGIIIRGKDMANSIETDFQASRASVLLLAGRHVTPQESHALELSRETFRLSLTRKLRGIHYQR